MTRSVNIASSRNLTSRRRALMLSCAAAAVAAGVIHPQKARAQAFQGSITSSVNASQTSVGAGTETITVTGSKAVIDWSPDLSGTGTIDFLPNGNVATFQGGSGVTQYTVLNRVVPDASRAIGLNGAVQSRIDGGSTGGNVWFYSPNGIVIGSTAVFDVGGLLLTTAFIPDINEDGSPDFSSDTDGFTLRGLNVVPGSTIEVEAGAQIRALQDNSTSPLSPRVSCRAARSR